MIHLYLINKKPSAVLIRSNNGELLPDGTFAILHVWSELPMGYKARISAAMCCSRDGDLESGGEPSSVAGQGQAVGLRGSI